jgi:hypothetical protein
MALGSPKKTRIVYDLGGIGVSGAAASIAPLAGATIR